MRTEFKVFGYVSAVLYLFAAVYGLWTHSQSMFDRAGFSLLVLGGTLASSCAGYFAFVARRIPPRPSDSETGNIEDGAGPIGWFSPASFWPLGIGISVAIMSVGLACEQLWLAAAGLIGVLITVAGLLFENYRHSGRNPSG